MKSRTVRIIVGAVLVYNLSLVVLTALLSLQATLQHPMQGTLVASGEYKLHVIDSPSAGAAGSAAVLSNDSAPVGVIDIVNVPGNDSAMALDDTDLQSPERPSSQRPLSTKTTFVLIHGASTSALDFSTNLQPALAMHARVVSIDRPGHGYSERGLVTAAADPAYQARMILNALDTLGIHDPVLIGHSWAGSVIMAALLNEHNTVQVKAGILIAGATHPWEGENPLHVRLSSYPVFGDIFRWQYISPIGRLSLQSAVEGVFSPEKVPDNYIDDTGLALSIRPGTYRHNAQDRTSLSAILETQSLRYPDVSTPLLSIAASEDTVVPAWNHHDRLVAQIPHMQSLMIEGSGHAPHHTQTQTVVDAILNFTQSIEPSVQ